MILRLDPAADQAQLLSLPRDLYVPIAGLRGSDRINSRDPRRPRAAGRRRSRATSASRSTTTSRSTSSAFREHRRRRSAACPSTSPSRCATDEPGSTSPSRAASRSTPCRPSRTPGPAAYEYFQNGRWHTDGTGDLGRISRQQDFIRRVLQRAIARGARNPAVLNDLLNAGRRQRHLDDRAHARGSRRPRQAIQDFNPDSLDTYSVPVYDAVVNGGGGAPPARRRRGRSRCSTSSAGSTPER